MPGLFAMKRESWARLVRVSSLPRYAPSRRIAKGLSLSLSRFSLWTTAGTTSQPPDPGNVRSVHFQPRSLSLLSSVVRRSLPADGTKGDPLRPTSSFPEWSGVEWRGEEDILATLIPYPCTERPSGRPVLPCRPPAENFQVHRAESPSSLTVTGWNLGNVFVPLRVAEGMRNVWRF